MTSAICEHGSMACPECDGVTDEAEEADTEKWADLRAERERGLR